MDINGIDIYKIKNVATINTDVRIIVGAAEENTRGFVNLRRMLSNKAKEFLDHDSTDTFEWKRNGDGIFYCFPTEQQIGIDIAKSAPNLSYFVIDEAYDGLHIKVTHDKYENPIKTVICMYFCEKEFTDFKAGDNIMNKLIKKQKYDEEAIKMYKQAALRYFVNYMNENLWIYENGNVVAYIPIIDEHEKFTDFIIDSARKLYPCEKFRFEKTRDITSDTYPCVKVTVM